MKRFLVFAMDPYSGNDGARVAVVGEADTLEEARLVDTYGVECVDILDLQERKWLTQNPRRSSDGPGKL